ncbi:MAG: hypothetical protein MUC94_18595 [bacterium]|nr:hypothetical protein [bacterium]
MSAMAHHYNISLKSLLSQKVEEMDDRINLLKQKYKDLWLETDSTFPEFANSYTRKQKQELEYEATDLLDRITKDHHDGNADRNRLKEILQQSGDEIVRLCGLAGLYVDKQFTDGFDHATKMFLRQVKKFDPELKPENIYQAMRNVWIANSLQKLMDMKMDCSAPLFAYSMLYPYSDNVNDDAGLSAAEKISMNQNFRQWLEGESCPYQNETERKIYLLVKMIEEKFPREKFPGVFQSLLGIFNAQIKSLSQQKQHRSGNGVDILDISFEKGGTSVLADGYLIRGNLNEELEDFCFGYGAFLQFADDIQDVDDDQQNGHQTIFMQLAEHKFLDAMASRLFNYMIKVVDLHLSDPRCQRLRELIIKNCFFMVQEAIIKTKQFYSADYIRSIEPHFPFAFSYFQRVKKRLKGMLLNGRKKYAAR